MRYIIVDSEVFEGTTYRFAYDTKYKTFARVQKFIESLNSWENVRLAPENFYVYFPGHALKSRTNNKIFWKKIENENESANSLDS